ncbi:MAG: acetyl-CoA C-acyltransferase [Proteobacteria bacterium]|nr:acetyl-CoA C-acyltransferase [Pseudomonadota bacterium]MBU4597195.1 acetyl-CoA C-acyltransferase [Pseudomonadota bacterium]
MPASSSPPTRVVIIDGKRTPFLRSGTQFSELMAYDLGRMAVAGLMHHTRLDPSVVDLLVMGNVIQEVKTSNLGREVALGAGLDRTVPAFTVTMACVSSLQSFLSCAQAIQAGQAEVAIAAGAELLSDVPIRVSRPVRKRLIAAQKVKGPLGYFSLLGGLSLKDLAPEAPAIAEFSTGEVMGQNCERLVKRLGIGRGEQDEYALMSHQRAAWATEQGLLAPQIEAAYVPPFDEPLAADNGFHAGTSLEKLGRLRPAFDKRLGTVTAGNSSFLTDGAGAVLLASEAAAQRLGLAPLAYLKSVSVTALDPLEELLLGPALSIPRVLAQAGLELGQVEVLELHEAFAGQVLSVLKLLNDETWCRQRLGRQEPVGEVDLERLNAWGGSLSVGHPFGATGARLITTCCHRMAREKAHYGLVAACAAGALGIGMLLEAVS